MPQGHKALDGFGRIAERVHARTASARTASARTAGAAGAAGSFISAGATAEGVAGHRLAGDHLIEALELVRGFVGHARAQQGSQIVDLPGQTLGLEDAALELLHPGQIGLLECRHREDPLEEPVLAGPRLLDAELLALLLAALHGEVAEGVVEIPGHELEPIGLRVQVHHVVLTEGEDRIEGAQPHRHRHEPTEGVDIEELRSAAGEFGIVGLRDQPGEVDDPLLLFRRQLGLGVVDLLVGLPIIAEILEQRGCDRLEDRALLGPELRLGPTVVGILDDGIQTEVAVGVDTRRGDPHPGVGGARRRHSAIAIQRIGQGLVHPRRVGDVVVEVDLGHAGELLFGNELVEIDLEGLLVAHARPHVRAVALVAHGDIGQALAPDLQIGVDVFEDDARRAAQAVAPAFLRQEHRPESAAPGATAGPTRAAGTPRPPRPPGTSGFHRQRPIETLPQRIGVEMAFLVLVPFRRPAPECAQEFIAGHCGILIGIERPHPHRRHEPIGVEAPASSERTLTAALGLEGLPLPGRKLKPDIPDLLQ